MRITACGSRTITAISLGSLIDCHAAPFRHIQASETSHNVLTVGATVAVSRVRSHSTGRTA